MKKIWCLLAAVLLIMEGLAGLGAFFIVGLNWLERGEAVFVKLLFIAMFLTSVLAIGAGAWLFSFKKQAWKFAVAVYRIMLGYLICLNLVWYVTLLHLGNDGGKHPFLTLKEYVTKDGAGIGLSSAVLFCLVFLSILATLEGQFIESRTTLRE